MLLVTGEIRAVNAQDNRVSTSIIRVDGKSAVGSRTASEALIEDILNGELNVRKGKVDGLEELVVENTDGGCSNRGEWLRLKCPETELAGQWGIEVVGQDSISEGFEVGGLDDGFVHCAVRRVH